MCLKTIALSAAWALVGCSVSTDLPTASTSTGVTGGGGAGGAGGSAGAGGQTTSTGDGGTANGGGDEGGADADYFEDFESGPAPSGWQLSARNAAWEVVDDQAVTGTHSLQSGMIGNDNVTTASVALDFSAPGEIEFWHRESSREGFDELQFHLDGQLMASYSGETTWQPATFVVTAPGIHALEWRYIKARDTTEGDDLVWIDTVSATNAIWP